MIAVLKVLALVVVVAGGWAVLATLFTPLLTSGWREGMEAVMRRWTLAVIAYSGRIEHPFRAKPNTQTGQGEHPGA